MDYLRLLELVEKGNPPTRMQMERLLQPHNDPERQALMEAARRVRDTLFGRKVFLYGFVYFSTHCRNSCSFCLYRKGNPHAVRYRKRADEVFSTVERLRNDGVHLVDLTMGEDPFYHTSTGSAELLDMVHGTRHDLDVPVMVSPGVLSSAMINDLSKAGADWLACYQETHNMTLFQRLRPGQDYQYRLAQKRYANRSGMLSEEGLLIGVGESLEDIATSIGEMEALGVQQVRAMSFVPQTGTPLEMRTPGATRDELTTIAVMRLAHPDKLIPASLDVEGQAGMIARLEAGANVVTSIIPQDSGFKGVANQELDILNGDRSMDSVRQKLCASRYAISTRTAYESWMEMNRPGYLGAS